MKGLVIENEYDVDSSVKAFLKDNEQMFTSVHEETFCKEKTVAELAPLILDTDAIIIATTWMYIDQVEDYIDAFLSGKLGDKKIKFYVHQFTRTLNDWKTEWSTQKDVRSKVIQLMNKGFEVFTFSEDYDNISKVTDRYNHFGKLRERNIYTSHPIEYSAEHDVFFTESRYETLEQIIDEYKS